MKIAVVNTSTKYTFEYAGKSESDKIFDTFTQNWNEIANVPKLISERTSSYSTDWKSKIHSAGR